MKYNNAYETTPCRGGWLLLSVKRDGHHVLKISNQIIIVITMITYTTSKNKNSRHHVKYNMNRIIRVNYCGVTMTQWFQNAYR